MRLPDGDGLDLLEWMRRIAPVSVRSDHRARQRGNRGARAEARRVRFRFQAARSRRPAQLVTTALKLSQPTDAGVINKHGTRSSAARRRWSGCAR